VDVAEVRLSVAAAIVDPDVRERFLTATDGRGKPALRDSAPPSSGFPDTRPSVPREGTPLRPGDVDKAAASLARSMGPIGKVLAGRCAEGAATREQFVARVLEQLAARVDARTVEADLWRSLI
jgi:serine/threonine-protein kinase